MKTNTPPGLALSFTAQVGEDFIPYLRRQLRAAHRMIPNRLRELSIVLVNDPTMSSLHRKAMNVRGPTDVLTFPLDSDARGYFISGEVVVCVPEARRRSTEHGTRVRDELLLYALHGMLHLSGFDDRTHREFHRMHRTEDRILTRLGVGPVFCPAARSSEVMPHRARGQK